MNLDFDEIVWLAFTHPRNRGKSIRRIARDLNMNPGSFYRILKRLGLVAPENNAQRQHPDPRRCQSDLINPDDPARCPDTPHPSPNPLQINPELLEGRFRRTKKNKKNIWATATPGNTPPKPLAKEDAPPKLARECQRRRTTGNPILDYFLERSKVPDIRAPGDLDDPDE